MMGDIVVFEGEKDGGGGGGASVWFCDRKFRRAWMHAYVVRYTIHCVTVTQGFGTYYGITHTTYAHPTQAIPQPATSAMPSRLRRLYHTNHHSIYHTSLRTEWSLKTAMVFHVLVSHTRHVASSLPVASSVPPWEKSTPMISSLCPSSAWTI
jgi:hypothetical protein